MSLFVRHGKLHGLPLLPRVVGMRGVFPSPLLMEEQSVGKAAFSRSHSGKQVQPQSIGEGPARTGFLVSSWATFLVFHEAQTPRHGGCLEIGPSKWLISFGSPLKPTKKGQKRPPPPKGVPPKRGSPKRAPPKKAYRSPHTFRTRTWCRRSWKASSPSPSRILIPAQIAPAKEFRIPQLGLIFTALLPLSFLGGGVPLLK